MIIREGMLDQNYLNDLNLITQSKSKQKIFIIKTDEILQKFFLYRLFLISLQIDDL